METASRFCIPRVETGGSRAETRCEANHGRAEELPAGASGASGLQLFRGDEEPRA